jgi:hypothetical protein
MRRQGPGRKLQKSWSPIRSRPPTTSRRATNSRPREIRLYRRTPAVPTLQTAFERHQSIEVSHHHRERDEKQNERDEPEDDSADPALAAIPKKSSTITSSTCAMAKSNRPSSLRSSALWARIPAPAAGSGMSFSVLNSSSGPFSIYGSMAIRRSLAWRHFVISIGDPCA